jgi:hypothetical protein
MTAYFGTGAGNLSADPGLAKYTDYNKSFGGGEAYNYNSGNLAKKGSGQMWGAIGAAGLGMIGDIFSSQNQAAAMQQASWNSAKAQEYAANSARQLGWDQAKAQMGTNLSNQLAQIGYGADIEFERQKQAKDLDYNRFGPKASAQMREDARAAIGAQQDPLFKSAAFQNLMNETRKKGFEMVAPGAAMFGDTGFSKRFTNMF